MALGIFTNSGERMLVTVPTRYHAYTSDGSKYSLTAAADFLADAGFDGADLSLDQLEPDGDDVLRSVLYSFGNRAAARGLVLPMCHLPFFMPNPDDTAAMARFSREIAAGLRIAAMLKIPDAVIHPIVRHESRRCRDLWLDENIRFLSPLRELAGKLGVTLCIENMTGKPYAAHPAEAVFGSTAADVLELSDRLDTSICWDFGHANLTGLCQSVELEKLCGRVRCLHIHDNDGATDSHRIPGECAASTPLGGAVDWEDAAEGLRLCEFLSTSNRCINLELKTSDLPADRSVRLSHAARALDAAKKLANLL
ncbi:MAG: sugar phosphate isomerase/epimerase [Clostridia bacterium]|nr:sugar phosphate isomerase/epimerase [Clostridia bacterium]